MSESAAEELLAAAAHLDLDGDEAASRAVRGQARSHRVEAIRLRGLAAGESYMAVTRALPPRG
ncbi:hypothetical protein [Methylobacterium nigriterrae]|uniref:hypothetical protein n=1 Tax=Methylobacterium nigriterrae TaxID=3127512 RepID=UPI003013B6E0